jgi:succinoglycan biosynthesis protein ExoA
VTIGIVIPCRNEADWITGVLDAVAGQDRQPDAVVVVNDGSSDATGRIVEGWQRANPTNHVRLIDGPARGVAAAVNAGVAALKTDIIIRLDGHCRPANDYVRRAAEHGSQPGVGVAGGAWNIEPGSPSLEAESIAIAVEHPLGSGGALYRHPTVSEPTSVDTVPYGCFRRSTWEVLGGLDERLLSNEDYDFNFRVRQRGLRVVLDPRIRCTYYARPTIRSLAAQYARYGWWKARMLMHHPRSIRLRQLVPAMLVPALAGLAIAGIFADGQVWLVGLGAYPVAVLIGACHAAATRHNWRSVGWIAASFLTIHLTWSLGFWASVIAAPLTQAAPGQPHA